MIIGTDIETFIELDGKIINACGIVKGSKNDPYHWKKGGYSTSLDCLMMEYNTPPTDNLETFKKDILDSQEYLKTLLPKNAKLCFDPYRDIEESELTTIESLTFGCSPDYNIYTGKINKIKKLKDYDKGRSIGMHLHIDVDKSKKETLIKFLDITLGIPSVILEPQNLRRTLYGNAGSYRDNGKWIEYRVLSGYFQQKEYLDFIYKNAELAVNLLDDPMSKFLLELDIRGLIEFNERKYINQLCMDLKLLEHLPKEINVFI